MFCVPCQLRSIALLEPEQALGHRERFPHTLASITHIDSEGVSRHSHPPADATDVLPPALSPWVSPLQLPNITFIVFRINPCFPNIMQ